MTTTPLTALNDVYSLTVWRSETGFTACIQSYAGECPRQATKRTASEAIEAVLHLQEVMPPCPVDLPK